MILRDWRQAGIYGAFTTGARQETPPRRPLYDFMPVWFFMIFYFFQDELSIQTAQYIMLMVWLSWYNTYA